MEKKQQEYLIREFLKGKLDPEQERELLSWVKEKPENKTLFLEQQKLFGKEILSVKNLHVESQWNRLFSRIDLPKQKTGFLFSRTAQVSAVAASFILGIIITALSVTNFQFSSQSASNTQEISTPYGARTSFELPDGSKVWLNSGSKLIFPRSFGKKRPVKLIGEAFFEVQKGKKPFIVSTSYGDVEVLGTSFNVEAFDGEGFKTTLVSGLVQVNADARKLRIKPGEQVHQQNGKMKIRNVNTNLFTSWKDGKLLFVNEYLPQIIKKLERWYNIHIEMEDDPSLKRISFTGRIEMESFTEVMELLKMTSPIIEYDYNEKTRTIKITKSEDYEEVFLRK